MTSRRLTFSMSFPVRLDTYAGMQPTLYGRYYPRIGARQYDQSRAKEFVIPRYPAPPIKEIPQGSSLYRV